MNLNQVTVEAVDVAQSVSFYRRLGFIQIVDAPHYARFACPEGESTFSVHSAAGPAVSSGTVLYFECAHLDQTVAGLQAKGFSFTQLPLDEPWLWREARLVDPAGNIICLYWAGVNRRNPPWRLPGVGK